MFRGKQHFNVLKLSSEGISTNILSDRLDSLIQEGLIECLQDQHDKRSKSYSLTDKGWDLLPVMLSIFEWSYQHDDQSYLTKDSESYFRGDIERIKSQLRDGSIIDFGEP